MSVIQQIGCSGRPLCAQAALIKLLAVLAPFQAVAAAPVQQTVTSNGTLVCRGHSGGMQGFPEHTGVQCSHAHASDAHAFASIGYLDAQTEAERPWLFQIALSLTCRLHLLWLHRHQLPVVVQSDRQYSLCPTVPIFQPVQLPVMHRRGPEHMQPEMAVQRSSSK